MEPKIQFAKRGDGVRIAYIKMGEGYPFIYPAPWVTHIGFFLEDPTVRAFWERIAQHFMVVFYDKHGCGMSDRDRAEFTFESELSDLETVIEHIGLDRFILFGISMAGPISIAYAARHPEKVSHLILYGTFADGNRTARDDVKTAIISLIRSAWGLGSEALSNLFVPEASREIASLYTKFQRESCSAEIAAKLIELVYTMDVTELLPRIKAPTLVLHREGDRMSPAHLGREMAVEIPNSHFRIFKGNIHIPWLGDSEELIREMLDFLLEGESKISDSIDGRVTKAKERDGERMDSLQKELSEQATIVFSDIVSSTDMVTTLGDFAARELFLEHDRVIRDQLQRYGGKELQSLGDGFMMSFNSASAAIQCASDIQKELGKTLPTIVVRMGINTGEVVLREGDHPFGQAVVVASRIASKAKGGQILVSDVTKQLVAGRGLSFEERGRAKLKGISESIKLHEVVWQKLKE